MTETKKVAEELRKKGTGEDTILAHINPHEAEILKLMGGMGKPNPETGLPEYKSWFSKVIKIVVPIVIAVVAPELAGSIGTALGFAKGSMAAIAAGQAVISGTTTAVTGGKPSEILKSALGGAVAAGVTSSLAGSVGTLDPVTGETVGASGLKGLTGSAAGGQALAKGIGTTAGGLAAGNDLKTAALGGLISGGVDYFYGEAPADATKTDKAVLNLEKGLTSAALNNIFNQPASYQPNQPSPTATFGTSKTNIAGSGSDVGSAALGQALRLGDAGSPIFGSGEKEGEKQSGWNVESLRYMGQEAQA